MAREGGIRRVRTLRGDGGSAMLEFALTVPFLSAVVFGTVDLGRSWALKHRLENMAREGAGYAQFHPGHVAPTAAPCTNQSASQNILARTRNEDRQLGADPGFQLEVTNLTTGAVLTGCSTSLVPGQQIRVRAKLTTFKPVTPLVQAWIGKSVTLKGDAVVVVQG
jgi:Flp pilus assembly protein TadG